jgi:hypothetical protein
MIIRATCKLKGEIMFIMIFEDGRPYLAQRILDSDIRAFEDGILDIIDPKTTKQLAGVHPNMTWCDLDLWEVTE